MVMDVYEWESCRVQVIRGSEIEMGALPMTVPTVREVETQTIQLITVERLGLMLAIARISTEAGGQGGAAPHLWTSKGWTRLIDLDSRPFSPGEREFQLRSNRYSVSLTEGTYLQLAPTDSLCAWVKQSRQCLDRVLPRVLIDMVMEYVAPMICRIEDVTSNTVLLESGRDGAPLPVPQEIPSEGNIGPIDALNSTDIQVVMKELIGMQSTSHSDCISTPIQDIERCQLAISLLHRLHTDHHLHFTEQVCQILFNIDTSTYPNQFRLTPIVHWPSDEVGDDDFDFDCVYDIITDNGLCQVGVGTLNGRGLAPPLTPPPISIGHGQREGTSLRGQGGC